MLCSAVAHQIHFRIKIWNYANACLTILKNEHRPLGLFSLQHTKTLSNIAICSLYSTLAVSTTTVQSHTNAILAPKRQFSISRYCFRHRSFNYIYIYFFLIFNITCNRLPSSQRLLCRHRVYNVVCMSCSH